MQSASDYSEFTPSADYRPEQLNSLTDLMKGVSMPLWMDHGACVSAKQTLFFGEDTPTGKAKHRPVHADAHEAKEICSRCPVREECLNFAVDNNETYGVWGGLTPRERERLVRAHEYGR